MDRRTRRKQPTVLDFVSYRRTRMVRYTMTFERGGEISGCVGTTSAWDSYLLLDRQKKAEAAGFTVTLDMESAK